MSPLVFNFISPAQRSKLKTRRAIPYIRAPMYYNPVYMTLVGFRKQN